MPPTTHKMMLFGVLEGAQFYPQGWVQYQAPGSITPPTAKYVIHRTTYQQYPRLGYHKTRIALPSRTANCIASFYFYTLLFHSFSRLNSISIILFWENTGSASENYLTLRITFPYLTNLTSYLTFCRTLHLILPYFLPPPLSVVPWRGGEA